MCEPELYEITNPKIIVPKGMTCTLKDLAQVLLVVQPSSTRRQGLFLSIRLRTIWDQNFTQVDIPDKLQKKDYPEGSDKADPAKLLAHGHIFTIHWNGKNGNKQEAWFEVRCREYFQKVQVKSDLSLFFDLS
ncbi:MAG: hypothetical protein P1P90_06620 [Patescibacteria group bacterium]|nr:hypothetical protein [Patescibacteria group bacterium]